MCKIIVIAADVVEARAQPRASCHNNKKIIGLVVLHIDGVTRMSKFFTFTLEQFIFFCLVIHTYNYIVFHVLHHDVYRYSENVKIR